MDSAQDVHPGQLGRPGIPRSMISGFNQPLPVIYSAQPSEAAVSMARLGPFTLPGLQDWLSYAISPKAGDDHS